MFITNPLNPAETLAQLLSIKGVSKESTSTFKNLRHDRDLCPRIRESASTIVDSYKSFGFDVYDTQGPRDDGIDVVFKFLGENGNREIIGIQVKDFKEIEDWRKKEATDFIQKLKAQYAGAIAKAKASWYYILLCTDEVEHYTQIRRICSELKDFDRLSIILPRKALAFIDLEEYEIRASVSSFLCKEDPVYVAARNEIDPDHPIVGLMKIALLCDVFSGKTEWTDKEIFILHSEMMLLVPNLGASRSDIGEVMEDLVERSFIAYKGDDGFSTSLDQLPSNLCAVYFDQFARGSRTNDMAKHLYTLLCPPEFGHDSIDLETSAKT